MNFNLPRAIIVVILIALAIFLFNGVTALWHDTHSVGGVAFLACASLAVLILGGTVARRLR